MSSATKSPTVTDLEEFKSLLSNTSATILVPADGSAYQASITRWSIAANKPASISVQPTNAEEVSLTLKFAGSHGFDVAVKGGGHSTAGASSTAGGLLIDLGKMRSVAVEKGSDDEALLRIQGGALWGDVDDAAWAAGFATVGGTVRDTGVGGLTLGGGYGVLSGERGLVIDNFVEATIVLANGEVKRASHSENEDLFWALLGAGPNFGVVTEFVLRAYPQKEVFMGIFMFPPTPEMIKEVVTVLNDWYEVKETPDGKLESKSNGKTLNLFGFTKPPPLGGQTVLILTATYNGTEAEGRAFYQPLFDLNPIMQTMAMAPYPKANDLVPSPPGMRASMKGTSFTLPVRPEFITSMHQEFETFTAANADAAGSIMAWEFYDPRKVYAGQNTGCFANRGLHLNGLVLPMWTEEANDAKFRQWARDMTKLYKDELEKQQGVKTGTEASVRGKKGAVMLYGNYDQYDEKSKDIFGENYPRLQQLKAKYDPGNMFNKLFPITPQA